MAFNGQLKNNEVIGALYNMIISVQTFADNLKGGVNGELAELSRVDGGMYGDTKLYTAVNVPGTVAWTDDSEASNLLTLHRPATPNQQPISIDTFRMVALTIDEYMTKRAFATEGSFAQFNSVVLGTMEEAKRAYDATTFNTYLGTAKSAVGTQNISITLGSDDQENAMTVAAEMAKLLVDVSDISRDYNDLGFYRSYDKDDLIFVWNSDYVANIRKQGLPTIFHSEGLVDKFAKYVLPAKYFGTINAGTGTTDAANTTVRAAKEIVIGTKHYFAGELLDGSTAYGKGETYTQDSSVICKVIHKNSIPYMTGFRTGTEFFNPRSLTQTHYLIWSHNTLEYLQNYPMITVSAVEPVVPETPAEPETPADPD